MSSVRATPIRVPAIAIPIICWALLACAFLAATQQAAPPEAVAKPPKLSTLGGASAVRQLRQDGSYQSLAQAVSTVTQQTKLTAGDGAGSDSFGREVAVSGDTVVVGADLHNVNSNSDQGSAYVFVRSGATWTQQQKLTAGDGAAGDFFGISVAISGDTIIVGASGHGFGSNTSDQGAAYVFVRSGATWTQQRKLAANDGSASDRFGGSVAINGETAVVGAELDDSAYVYLRDGTTWTQQQKLTAGDGVPFDSFGVSVAISGETIVVGAWNDDVGANPKQGSAYVFVRSLTTWTQQQKLTAGDGAPSDLFGDTVAISAETVVVGAPLDNVGANSDQGSAYVFVRSGTTWAQQQKLTAGDGAAGDEFGTVAISGDSVVAGALTDDVNPNANQGSAYLFVRVGQTWTEQQKLTAGDGAAGDRFGGSVAVSPDTIVVGAPADSSAYVFGSPASPTPTPTPSPTPNPTPTPGATPTPTPAPASSVQFTSATFSVDEAANGGGMSSPAFVGASPGGIVAQVVAVGTVTRTGDSSQPASVDYETNNATASDRSDYTAVLGTLFFSAGQVTQSINVPVANDVLLESPETFTVTLSNPIGTALGSPSVATVTIHSDDAVTGANPVRPESFNAEFFVRQHYLDFLNREADPAGLAFWMGQTMNCGHPDLEVCRINVSAAFFLSIEFQETGYLVYLFHQAAFDAGERLQLRTFLRDTQGVNRGVVVGQAGFEHLLEQNKQAYALAFVQRQEFLDRNPVALTPAQFVDALNANTGGSLSQSERDALVAELAANDTTAGRASALRKIADDADFRAREMNRAFVLLQYYGYLRRNPDEAPDANLDGYNFWLQKLNQFNGNFANAEMVKAFLVSGEYIGRFGP